MTELSLCLAVWNTSHLLKRSIETYIAQDLDPSRWELIVIDDNSLDDVRGAIAGADKHINIRYVRLEHGDGMRGNTVSFNTAFGMAKGHVLAETTPETMLPRDLLRRLLEPHQSNPRCFVAMKTYNLTVDGQISIDTVDWRSDLMNMRSLPEWGSTWTQNNVKTVHFGTHQTCSIRREVWFEITKGRGFPLFGDYGSDDPWYAGTRSSCGVQDITLPNDCMGVHQWHPSFQYWMAKGHAPKLNKWAHSMSNYLNDTSGNVPDGGTCMIWDGGSHDQMSQADKDSFRPMDAQMVAVGVSPNMLITKS